MIQIKILDASSGTYTVAADKVNRRLAAWQRTAGPLQIRETRTTTYNDGGRDSACHVKISITYDETPEQAARLKEASITATRDAYRAQRDAYHADIAYNEARKRYTHTPAGPEGDRAGFNLAQAAYNAATEAYQAAYERMTIYGLDEATRDSTSNSRGA